MNQEEYSTTVRSILDDHKDAFRERLLACLSKTPEKAESANIQIFMDQDGEGFLDIRFSFDGPDWIFLQKEIKDIADLFETKMIDSEVTPDMPLMDPFDEEFSVHDTLSDTAAEWVCTLWSTIESSPTDLPVHITTHDEYGNLTPIQLQ